MSARDVAGRLALPASPMRALRTDSLANRVKVLSDGAEALACLRREVGEFRRRHELPHFGLLDLKLPRAGGLEVLRRHEASRLTPTIPVVVLTSSREESDLVASCQLGANSHIVKRVDVEQFMRAVGEVGLPWMVLNEAPG